MARPGSPVWILIATVLLFAANGVTAQNCSSATSFQAGRTFQWCNSLPVLGASLYWTYHARNGTADLAFRAPSGADGWVAWGINTNGTGMAGSSVFVATQNATGGAVSVLTTVLESFSPSLKNGTLMFAVPVPPTAEYTGGAYTIYATVALPGNSTLQNTVWQAGPLRGGSVAMHPTSGPNLLSFRKQDFLSG